ncbi:hypothetical protein [Thiomicrorhabdus indica]|uniref:hypothetical protein n=1 Tax=Thiomicrorhabdus indica TaxID=2267253 RepID=UPI002AA7AA0E|nr:hypothetical protein [Thiomicrorhabdus indica]
MKNPLVFIAAIDHPLVGERVTVGDLIKESFVAREEGREPSRRWMRFLKLSLAILDVENTPIQRFWYLVHLKEKRLSAVAETFRNFILDKAV